jgi:hypothetical protein
MFFLETTTITPKARRWLNTPGSAQVMHVFKKALNLVHMNGKVLSLVTPNIGPGPFSLVVSQCESGTGHAIEFDTLVDVDSPVLVSRGSFAVGSLHIKTSGAPLWQPRPEWASLAAISLKQQIEIVWKLLDESAPADSMAALLLGRPSETYHQKAETAWAVLARGLESIDEESCKRGAYGLAGLGPGLTPAGDDFLVGVMYAICSSPGNADSLRLIETIKDTAIPRTTRLSAAWLEAGAHGEASSVWHSLVHALACQDTSEVEAAATLILPTGHTSGADALAGFLAARTIVSEGIDA